MDTIAPPWLWLVFVAFVLAALLVDFWVLKKQGAHEVGLKEAIRWSLLWVALSFVFNALLWWVVRDISGSVAVANERSLEFLTGYLREGNDVLMISSGIMTMRALELAKLLQQDNISVAVLHCPTIKPLDEQAIVAAVRYKHRLLVVAENHSVIGGLGESVASTLLRHKVQPAGFQMAGLPDEFLDAGALPTLHDRYGISRDVLAVRIKGWLR